MKNGPSMMFFSGPQNFSTIFTFSDFQDHDVHYWEEDEFMLLSLDSEDELMDLSRDSLDSVDNENVDRASSEDKMESIQTRVRFPETWLWIDAVSG